MGTSDMYHNYDENEMPVLFKLFSIISYERSLTRQNKCQ